jgi:hypothetical protein
LYDSKDTGDFEIPISQELQPDNPVFPDKGEFISYIF